MLGYVLCMGLVFVGMFVYISVVFFVFIEYFGVCVECFGWFFGLNIFGVMFVIWCSVCLVCCYGLWLLLWVGSLLVCVFGLFFFGYVVFGEWGGLWVLVFGLLCFVSVIGLFGVNCIVSLLVLYFG